MSGAVQNITHDSAAHVTTFDLTTCLHDNLTHLTRWLGCPDNKCARAELGIVRTLYPMVCVTPYQLLIMSNTLMKDTNLIYHWDF